MQFNLKLSQKGLILVLVPLIFYIGFIIVLKGFVDQADAERRVEAHSKAIVTEANDLSKHLFDISGNIVALNFSQHEMVYNRYKTSLTQCKNGVRDLIALTSADKGERQRHIDRIRDLSPRVFEFIEGYGERAASGQRGIDFKTFRGELKAHYQPFLDELHSLADLEKTRAVNAPYAEKERQKKLNTLLIVGVTLNLLMMFLLSHLFTGITRRLRVLNRNAKNLARKEPLQEPLRGSDEIAELDGVFHEMAEALISAEQRKQEFVSTICHDLRSPLANVQVSLALASQGKYGDLNQKGVERFAKAEQSIERLITLLNELLDAEKMEAGLLELELAEMNLVDAINASVDAVKTLAESSKVQIELGYCNGRVMGDQARLIRVIVNLLSNAIKFSPPDSTVSVSVAQSDTTYDVRITDQGKGIAPEDREKIFDRFHRVSENTGPSGIGLGLTICRNIIHAHQGEIGVDSTPGQGSTFWFRLARM